MLKAEYREIDKRKIAINDKELSARLGRVCSHTDPEIYRVCEAVIQSSEPRCAVCKVPVTLSDDGVIDLEFTKLESSALAKNLRGSREAFVVACTLGTEVDRVIGRLSKTSRAEAFIFDAVASSVVEAALDALEAELTDGLRTAPRFSPGYGDFPLCIQGALLDFLGAPVHLGVALNDNGMMSPLKTVTAVIGIKGTDISE